MYGAILGDMIGSPYEFDQGGKSKEFPLFIESSHFTDDTVMTVAVADALMKTTGEPDDEVVREALVIGCSFGAGNTRMRDMERDLRSGYSRSIRSLTAAMETAQLCAFPRRDGWRSLCRRRDDLPGFRRK